VPSRSGGGGNHHHRYRTDVEKETQTRRRGRRAARPGPDSGPVGAFADRLWRLRREAGDPSYEEMAGRLGAAASKSSLAAAAQGRSLPSWETAWEFVRVLAVDRLGHDPADAEKEWREAWLRAKADCLPTDDTESEPAATPDEPSRPRRVVQAWVAAALAVLTGAVLTMVVRDREAGATPVVAHDDSRFEGDVTVPDGMLVPTNSSFTKIWRIRNTGTTYWANRFLARVNQEPCEAPAAVAIPQTRPGESVDIAVTVRTPGKPGRCKIFWKMADEQGRMLFPLKRPVYLDVRVGAK
jgi:hypothetical protein